MQVTAGKVVCFDYVLTGSDGQVIDSTGDGEPMSYLQGSGAIVPGLESALDGKSAGDEFDIVLPPAEAFGEHRSELCQVVPREHFQDFPELAVGMQCRVPTDQGEVMVTIAELTDDSVTLDGNHALAGEELRFSIVVRKVRAATTEEEAHGHAHEAGGHHH